MANPHSLQVGQKLWYVANERRDQHRNCDVTILKIGRRWATVDVRDMRVDLETLQVDGGNYPSPGCCHLSREAYEAERLLDAAWRGLAKHFDHYARRPAHVTIENINEALRLLGLDKEAK